jgi:hypothetical protein
VSNPSAATYLLQPNKSLQVILHKEKSKRDGGRYLSIMAQLISKCCNSSVAVALSLHLLLVVCNHWKCLRKREEEERTHHGREAGSCRSCLQTPTTKGKKFAKF